MEKDKKDRREEDKEGVKGDKGEEDKEGREGRRGTEQVWLGRDGKAFADLQFSNLELLLPSARAAGIYFVRRPEGSEAGEDEGGEAGEDVGGEAGEDAGGEAGEDAEQHEEEERERKEEREDDEAWSQLRHEAVALSDHTFQHHKRHKGSQPFTSPHSHRPISHSPRRRLIMSWQKDDVSSEGDAAPPSRRRQLIMSWLKDAWVRSVAFRLNGDPREDRFLVGSQQDQGYQWQWTDGVVGPSWRSPFVRNLSLDMDDRFLVGSQADQGYQWQWTDGVVGSSWRSPFVRNLSLDMDDRFLVGSQADGPGLPVAVDGRGGGTQLEKPLRAKPLFGYGCGPGLPVAVDGRGGGIQLEKPLRAKPLFGYGCGPGLPVAVDGRGGGTQLEKPLRAKPLFGYGCGPGLPVAVDGRGGGIQLEKPLRPFPGGQSGGPGLPVAVDGRGGGIQLEKPLRPLPGGQPGGPGLPVAVDGWQQLALALCAKVLPPEVFDEPTGVLTPTPVASAPLDSPSSSLTITSSSHPPVLLSSPLPQALASCAKVLPPEVLDEPTGVLTPTPALGSCAKVLPPEVFDEPTPILTPTPVTGEHLATLSSPLFAPQPLPAYANEGGQQDQPQQQQQERYLVWFPRFGLGNSLRGFCSAYVYALLSGRRLLRWHGGKHRAVLDHLCTTFDCSGVAPLVNFTDDIRHVSEPLELHAPRQEFLSALHSGLPVVHVNTGSFFDNFWHKNGRLAPCVQRAFHCHNIWCVRSHAIHALLGHGPVPELQEVIEETVRRKRWGEGGGSEGGGRGKGGMRESEGRRGKRRGEDGEGVGRGGEERMQLGGEEEGGVEEGRSVGKERGKEGGAEGGRWGGGGGTRRRLVGRRVGVEEVGTPHSGLLGGGGEKEQSNAEQREGGGLAGRERGSGGPAAEAERGGEDKAPGSSAPGRIRQLEEYAAEGSYAEQGGGAAAASSVDSESAYGEDGGESEQAGGARVKKGTGLRLQFDVAIQIRTATNLVEQPSCHKAPSSLSNLPSLLIISPSFRSTIRPHPLPPTTSLVEHPSCHEADRECEHEQQQLRAAEAAHMQQFLTPDKWACITRLLLFLRTRKSGIKLPNPSNNNPDPLLSLLQSLAGRASQAGQGLVKEEGGRGSKRARGAGDLGDGLEGIESGALSSLKPLSVFLATDNENLRPQFVDKIGPVAGDVFFSTGAVTHTSKSGTAAAAAAAAAATGGAPRVLLLALCLSSFTAAISAQWIKGFVASYYALQNRPNGACGYPQLHHNTASMSTVGYANGSNCGACFQMRCTGHPSCKPGIMTVPVTVTNICPPNAPGGYCAKNKRSITLPNPVWNQMSKDPSAGVVPVEIKRVRCRRVGGVAFNITGKEYYVTALPLNVAGAGALKRVDISIARGPWMAMRKSYGAVWDLPGLPVVGMSLSFRLWPALGTLPLEAWDAVPANWKSRATALVFPREMAALPVLVALLSLVSLSQSAPCLLPQVTINVTRESHLYLRKNYPANQYVTMVLQASIQLTDTFVMDAKFSCTVFRSDKDRAFDLISPSVNAMVTKIVNTNNVLVIGVNFKMPVSTVGQRDCNYIETRFIDFIGKYACPAVWLYRVWGVQVVQGNVYGRVEVARANRSRIDSMNVLVKATNQPGAIVVMLSGDGPNLIRSEVVISNNNIRTEGTMGQGATVGIMLFRGAVGVNIIGNRLSHFTLNSIQLGWGQSNVGDAMLTLIAQNDFVHGFGQLGDSAGIYFNTHWVNPGNVLRCNYVRGGGHCLYFDWVSSGVIVDGLVCDQTADGLKLNTGKNNEIRGMVVIDSKQPLAGYISCQNYGVNNCNKPNGIRWNNDLLTYYQTPGIKKLFPFLTKFCNKTSINGIYCNEGTSTTPGPNITGRCSGLPTENIAEIVTATTDNSTRLVIHHSNCNPFMAMPKLNKLTYLPVKLSAAGFRSVENRDFGLLDSSQIRAKLPTFRGCPVQDIGPKNVPYTEYFALFNRDVPLMVPIAARPASVGKNGSASSNVGYGGGKVSGKVTLQPNPYATTKWSPQLERELRPGFM
ncbi:unnamed protein product, partial [Closterium sp. NIES-64]